LDESGVHFQAREDEDACLRLVQDFPQLVVFRSFSTAYGLAGLRAGYAVGSPQAAQLLDSLNPVLGVNALTQAAVRAALQRCDGEVARRRDLVIEQRRRVEDAFAELALASPRSEAHFVWLRVSGMTSEELAAAFRRAGVIVFPGAALGDPDHVRVSFKGSHATERFLTVLAEIAKLPVYGEVVEVAA
jgi:histidinol-phosphate aminotransferase